MSEQWTQNGIQAKKVICLFLLIDKMVNFYYASQEKDEKYGKMDDNQQ